MDKKRKRILIGLLMPFFIMIFAFELLPGMMILSNGFIGVYGGFTLENFKIALLDPFYAQGMKNSVLISLQSSLIALIISLISIQFINKLPEKVTKRVIMLSNMTSNFSGVPLAFAFIILLGNNGVFTLLLESLGVHVFEAYSLYSSMGLTIVYVYFQIPLGILLLYPAIDVLRPEWKAAADNLGASTLEYWRYIGIPVLMPSIVATFSMLFANAMGAYATTYALMTSSYNLMPIRIGSLISGDLFLNPNLASAIAVILGGLLMVCNFFSERLLNKGAK